MTGPSAFAPRERFNSQLASSNKTLNLHTLFGGVGVTSNSTAGTQRRLNDRLASKPNTRSKSKRGNSRIIQNGDFYLSKAIQSRYNAVFDFVEY